MHVGLTVVSSCCSCSRHKLSDALLFLNFKALNSLFYFKVELKLNSLFCYNMHNESALSDLSCFLFEETKRVKSVF